ncbi:MAG: N-acetylglucosaminyldiphosphoundecaprenol [Pseudomonadota bacterium]|jgi:N-acetylglucosaminyldiphosphoundecaprenol N-acetyl-beta-D-mannosaminyltransferase
MKETILGYQVDNASTNECAEAIEREMVSGERTCHWLACLNPHSYVQALNDQTFAIALHNARWLVPDGVGVVLASWLLGGQVRERVTGSDIFYALHRRMNVLGGFRVFFLGATENTLTQIRARMALDYPNIVVAGTYSPPFKRIYSAEELDAMVSAVNAAQADVLWVGMTAPKQEKWIFENHARLNVRFAAAIGAVFDFYSENVKRSHPVFQRLGLEWLPRLLQQPRRLWRRMFVSAPIFVCHVVRAWWMQRSRRLRSRP